MKKFLTLKSTILLILLLVLGTFYIFTQYMVYTTNQETAKNLPKKSLNPTARNTSVLNVSPEQMRDTMINNYLLSPDKRFLSAFDEVNSMLGLSSTETISANIYKDRWKISFPNGESESVSSLPNFEELYQTLRHHIHAELVRNRIELSQSAQPKFNSSISTSSLDFHQIIRTLDQIDSQWKAGDKRSADIVSAASLYASLVFMHIDYMGLSDSLYAKAWATLALAEELGGAPLIRQRCLIAYGLGYKGFAWRASSALSDEDPLKAFLQENDKQLEILANRSNTTQEAKYLWLKRLGLNHNANAWKAWYQSNFKDVSYSLPVLVTALELGEFQTQKYFAMTMTQMALIAMAQEAAGIPELEKSVTYLKQNPQLVDRAIATGLLTVVSAPEADLIVEMVHALLPYSSGALMDEFEAGLSYASKQHDGPVMSQNSYASFYRGYFYSGIFMLSHFYLDNLSSQSSAKLLSVFIGSEGQTPVSSQVVQWYKSLQEATSRIVDPLWLQKTWGKLDLLGGKASYRLYAETVKHTGIIDYRLLQTTQQLASRLDSRYQNRYSLLDVSFQNLHDLPLTSRLAQNITHNSPEVSQGIDAWFAYFSYEPNKLAQLIKTRHMKPSNHLRALNLLRTFKDADITFIQSEYEGLIQAWPNLWEAFGEYAAFLESQQRIDDAIKIILQWMSNSKNANEFDKIYAAIALADMYEKQGHPDLGIEILSPVAISSYQGEALRTLARLFEATGQKPEAEAIADKAYQRYPNSLESMADLTNIYWRHGKYNEAANTIIGFQQPINEIGWRITLGEGFADAFADKSNDAVTDAFNSLKQIGIDHFKLMNFIITLGKKGRNELAFNLMSQLRWNGLGMMVIQVRAYQYLKAAKGKEIALKWLKGRVPSQYFNASSMIIYREKAYELLWDLIEDPDNGDHSDFVWLMRAASFASGAAFSQEQVKELSDYYGKVRLFKSYYDSIGSYMFDNISEKALLNLADSPNKRCEIAYYIALHAIHEKKLDYASDWFRVAMETGQEKMGEYRWSADQLYRWYSKGRALNKPIHLKTSSNVKTQF